MERKTASGIMLAAFLLGMLTLAFNIQQVKAEPTTWTVDDDGPADFSSIQEAINSPDVKDGDTIYVYSGTYYEHLVIEKTMLLVGETPVTTIIDGGGVGDVVTVRGGLVDNVAIQNFTIRNSGPGYPNGGIYIENCDNVLIRNNNITNNGWYGVKFEHSSNNIVLENNITNNYFDGILLVSSSNYNSISGNSITANSWGGIKLLSSSDNIVSGNNITGNNDNGILLRSSSNYNTISGNNITANNAFGIGLDWSSNYNNVSGNSITNNGYGIWLGESSNYNTISGNNITANNGYGIWLGSSNHNNIIQNNITANTWFEIYLNSSFNNSISGNNIIGNYGGGIALVYSSNNSISGNNIIANYEGIGLLYSSNNRIIGNNITNNDYGITLADSSNNSIYHNNIIYNTRQIYDYSWDYPEILPSINIWDEGYPSGGNYWSDYEERYPDATEIDDSGIWGTAYEIDQNNQDNYPLMEPWTSPPPFPTTIDELRNEIEELRSQGEIDNQGIVKSLIAKLNVVQRLVDKGKIDEAKSILEDDFIVQVQNLSGIHITPEAADILIQSAEHIISHI